MIDPGRRNGMCKGLCRECSGVFKPQWGGQCGLRSEVKEAIGSTATGQILPFLWCHGAAAWLWQRRDTIPTGCFGCMWRWIGHGRWVQGQKLTTSELATALVLERAGGGPGQAGGQGSGRQWADLGTLYRWSQQDLLRAWMWVWEKAGSRSSWGFCLKRRSCRQLR